MPDGELQKKVEQELPFQFRGAIQVSAKDGVVTLNGRLKTFYAKQQLQTFVMAIAGVRKVENCAKVESARK